jgi:hypothetical protein
MAERIQSMTPRRGKYPWHQWADGAVWRISRGQDFDVSVISMLSALRAHANSAGKAVTTRTVNGDAAIEFQFTTEPAAPVPAEAA